MVRAVAELSWKGPTVWPGTYDDYLEAKEAADAAREKAARLQAKEIARVERFIERFRYKATKAKQVQSRVKALEKVERIETESARDDQVRLPPGAAVRGHRGPGRARHQGVRSQGDLHGRQFDPAPGTAWCWWDRTAPARPRS